MDGVEIEISPLTAVQVEEHLSQEAEIIAAFNQAREAESDTKAIGERQDKLMLSLICHGVNNAKPEEKMTAERLKSEADPVLIQALQKDIMEMSGLKLIAPESPGEA